MARCDSSRTARAPSCLRWRHAPAGKSLQSRESRLQIKSKMAMANRFSGRTGRSFLAGCLLLLALAADGCSPATGNLSGKISYNGKPLAVGSVLFIGVDAQPRTAWIEADGSYHFNEVPVGEAKLAVN